jgi:hypothetical protein
MYENWDYDSRRNTERAAIRTPPLPTGVQADARTARSAALLKALREGIDGTWAAHSLDDREQAPHVIATGGFGGMPRVGRQLPSAKDQSKDGRSLSASTLVHEEANRDFDVTCRLAIVVANLAFGQHSSHWGRVAPWGVALAPRAQHRGAISQSGRLALSRNQAELCVKLSALPARNEASATG